MSMLPDPASPQAPKYWRYETTGRLEGPIMRYLEGKPLSHEDVVLIRLYLQQWIDSPVWETRELLDRWDDCYLLLLPAMRRKVRTIHDRSGIRRWLVEALDMGIDPL